MDRLGDIINSSNNMYQEGGVAGSLGNIDGFYINKINGYPQIELGKKNLRMGRCIIIIDTDTAEEIINFIKKVRENIFESFKDNIKNLKMYFCRDEFDKFSNNMTNEDINTLLSLRNPKSNPDQNRYYNDPHSEFYAHDFKSIKETDIYYKNFVRGFINSYKLEKKQYFKNLENVELRTRPSHPKYNKIFKGFNAAHCDNKEGGGDRIEDRHSGSKSTELKYKDMVNRDSIEVNTITVNKAICKASDDMGISTPVEFKCKVTRGHRLHNVVNTTDFPDYIVKFDLSKGYIYYEMGSQRSYRTVGKIHLNNICVVESERNFSDKTGRSHRHNGSRSFEE